MCSACQHVWGAPCTGFGHRCSRVLTQSHPCSRRPHALTRCSCGVLVSFACQQPYHPSPLSQHRSYNFPRVHVLGWLLPHTAQVETNRPYLDPQRTHKSGPKRLTRALLGVQAMVLTGHWVAEPYKTQGS